MGRLNIFNPQEDSSFLPAGNNEDASSEMIGSIILIGIFVAAFGIILVMLLSTSSEFIVPAVVIEADVIETDIIAENDTYVLNLRSGDTLKRNETIILVNGIDRTGDFSSDVGGQDWTVWGSGDSLTLDLAENVQPESVQIIYYEYPGGDGILLWDVGTSVTVIPPTGLTPKAAFSANVTSGFTPLSVQFTDLSSNDPYSWEWNFGDGVTSSEKNPVHTYTTPGVYTVQLTASNPDGSGTVVKSAYIHVSDGFTVDFVATPLSGTAPLMVTFTDQTTGTPTSWLWDFGDGATSTQQNPFHTYTAGGSYTVTLVATVGNVTQTEQKSAYINVTSNCIPGLYGTYVDEFNNNYQVPFSGNPTYRVDEIIWFSDYSGGRESIETDWPDATLGKKNRFGVTYEGYLIVPANDTYTFYLTSDDGSVLWLDDVLDSDPVLIDNWGGNGLHAPVEESASVYLTEGRHPIRVKMTEKTGGALLHLEWESAGIPREKIDSFCHIPGGLTVVDFVATPVSGVAPLEAEFTDLSVGNITSWAWDFGDGTNSTEQNPVHTYTVAGEYTVILVVSDGNVSYTEEKTDYIYVTEGCLPGLQGTYYDEYNSQYQIPFSGTPEQRVDLRLWFADSASGEESDEANWPVATIGKADTFSVVYEGNLIVPKDESYTFHLRSDDGSVLWIDNTADTDPVLINNWGLHSAITKSASKFLTKGKHPIRIKMTENHGKAVLHLEWESATIALQPVESFCHGTGTLLNAEFDATPLNGTRPLNVQFTDHSTGTLTSWLWDFGDGSSSILQNPAHIYTNSGQYTVSLTVEDTTTSDTRTKDQYITVSGMPSPVAWWRFDEASGSTAVDSSGNGNDGTIQGGVVDRRAGACGTGLYFNGTTTWVTVPDDATLSFNDSFTFAGWFRPEVPELLPGQGQFRYLTQIIGKGYDYYDLNQHSNNYEIFLKTQNDLLSFEANGDTDASSDQAFTSDASGLPVSYNDWFHLVVVVDGGVGLVYVDGNLVGDDFSVDRTPLQLNSEPVSIGKQISSGYSWAEFYYRGMMDELYLFGSVLTPDEISSLADACTPAPEQPPGVSFTGVPLTGDAPLNAQFNSTVSGSGPFTYLWNFSDGSTSNEVNPMHLYSSPGLYTVSLTVTNSAGSTSEVKEQYIDVTGMPLPVAWWRFDEASGSTAVDSSGNNNDGTIAGYSVDRRSGACGTGLYFDGSSTWVSVPDDNTLSFSDSFTFAGWFMPEVPITHPGQGFEYDTQIIGKGYDYYNIDQYSNNYEIFQQVENGRLSFEANGANDRLSKQAFISDAGGLSVSYDNWFHLAVVVDGGVGSVYVDGIKEGIFSVDRTPLQENNEPVSIGRQIVSGSFWADFYYKGMMDELYLYGTALTAAEVNTLADACTPPVGDPPEVSFTAAPVTGDAPLDVQFTSTVTGTTPFTYAWTFGEGTTSTEQNPVHIYTNVGTYDVSLTVTNAVGTDTLEKTAYIDVTDATVSAFAEYVVNENVFVYGNKLEFKGNSILGPGATIHITGKELKTNNLNGGSSIAVSNIYVDGKIELDGGSAGLGSPTSPGSIYVNGELKLKKGSRDIYGNVYVSKKCYLKDPVIHGNVYVNGDLELADTPDLTQGTAFYTGEFKYPKNMDSSILDKCVKVAAVPGFVIPDYNMPPVKSDDFYSSGGYVPDGTLANNIKIFAKKYTSKKWVPTAQNVIIVAEDGDIKLTKLGGSGVTGVLFAPKGKVEFDGGFFEGVVIARDGFKVTSGGTTVTFKNMNEYISNPADYPF